MKLTRLLLRCECEWYSVLRVFLWLASIISLSSCSDAPIISVMSYLEVDEYEWKTGTEMEIQGITWNQTAYMIPGDIVGLIFVCNASYPVEWEFMQDEHTDLNLQSQQIQAQREVGDINNPNTYKYSMRLALIGGTNLFTGNYVCKRTGDQDDQKTTIYVFWEGSNQPYLVAARENVTISSNDKDYVRLPCQVSSPEIYVYLQQEMNVTTSTTDLKNITVVETKNITTPGTNLTVNGTTTIVNATTTTVNTTRLVQVPVNKTELKFQDREFNNNKSGITFHPSYGFLLDTSKNDNGRYRCFTDQSDDDFVYTTVVPQSVPPKYPEINFIRNNATLFFNETERHLVCCSNSSRPPSFIFLYCTNFLTCKMMRRLVHSELIRKYSFGNTEGDGSCTKYPVYWESAGILRCFGDGIDITRLVMSSFEHTVNGTMTQTLYSSWSDIKHPEMLLQLSLQIIVKSVDEAGNPVRMGKGRQIYRGGSMASYGPGYDYELPAVTFHNQIYSRQNVSFQCSASQFYYAEGIVWTIEWRNKTVTIVDKTPRPENEWSRYYFYGTATNEQPVYIIVDSEMESVTCNAPVWNSTEWIKKSYKLNSRVPTLPSIVGSLSESVSWTLHETNQGIQCLAEGDPLPTLTWSKNGKEISEAADKNVQVTTANGSSTLTFYHVDYSIHGDYLCTATNILQDKVEKIFHVYVEEPHPWGVIITVICVSLTLIALIVALGWKLKVSRSTVRELRTTSAADD